MAALEFLYRDGGIYFPRLQLWFDPHRPKQELAFVSHAHSDHTARHREVVLTEPTSRLMRARLGGQRKEHILAFGERHEFKREGREFHLTLLPAGHILGSAMALLECDGQSLLYTGDFKLRPGLAAERCEPRRADVLIMETTFGRPRYEFPHAGDVLRELVRFCREATEANGTALLHCYSLGKTQEVLCGLEGANLRIALHTSAFEMTKIYEQFGHRFPEHQKLDSGHGAGWVVVCPPGASRPALPAGNPLRSAVITGWALDPGCKYQHRCDAAFPLSDHADFPDLITFVKRVQPRRIHTLHGFAADFAGTLRRMGHEAWALSEDEQLELALTLSHDQTVAGCTKYEPHPLP